MSSSSSSDQGLSVVVRVKHGNAAFTSTVWSQRRCVGGLERRPLWCPQRRQDSLRGTHRRFRTSKMVSAHAHDVDQQDAQGQRSESASSHVDEEGDLAYLDRFGLGDLFRSKQDDANEISVSKLPIVAIVGRPNVGKSMLVNRLAGQFTGGAIVEDVVGITRDRTYREAFWCEHEFQVVDTGGLVFNDDSTYLPEIRSQALIALSEASAAILVVDGRSGLNPLDEDLAAFLRKECGKLPIFVAVNKCESDSTNLTASEFWSLGLGEPQPVSAIHGHGTGDLLDRVTEVLPKVRALVDDGICNVAIVGRPNVGKSSLLNVLSNKDRAIVSNIPGTTRDSIDELVTVDDRQYRLIDTAGIRRKSSISYGTEYFMINRAFKAIRRADVVLLVVDVSQGLSEQDHKIAERIGHEGKACVIIANKWDLIDNKDNRSYKTNLDDVRGRLPAITWAKADLMSALTKQRTGKIIQYVNDAAEQHSRRVSTAVLNDVLREAVDWHKPPSTRQAKQGRIYYCTQVATKPPSIVVFVNDPKLFSDGYRRYMEKQFRSALGFDGTPLRIMWRGKKKLSSL